ncbi:MAG: DUF4340 domain-containing protein [Candidatus Saccharicenans sp.]|jgi:hypothetical protein|nr:DUF4340 domain-containing protein [Candidatus Saccharicenans sp.]MDH7492827.1 DUF4340 domain-containing protein [Candidatus Saccharicenans sp.]
MKFRTTLILLAIFLVLLAVVILVEHRSEKVQEKKEAAEKLTDFKADEVEKLSLKKEDGSVITLKKKDQGGWQLIEPLEAEADDYEANSLAENFASLRIDRVVEEQATDLAAYEIPKKEVRLWLKGQGEPLLIQVGMENPLDNALYARRADRSQVVLLPSYIKYSLDKKVFDLRKKDILKFETGKVQSIELKAKDSTWKVKREGDSWFFVQPLQALASKYQIDNLLDSLSGLRAKEFLAEEKDRERLKLFGLDQPEFTVSLGLPDSQEIVFYINRKDNKVIATTSLARKIIEVESQIATDLGKKVDELREKKVAVFNSWEAVGLSLKKEALVLNAFREKVREKGQEQDKWFLDGEGSKKEAADEAKIESLLRNLEYLEADEFIDRPASLQDYGLEPPALEIQIRLAPADQAQKDVQLLISPEDNQKKQVIIKNRDLPYLFRVKSDFLAEIPTKIEDWKQAPDSNK